MKRIQVLIVMFITGTAVLGLLMSCTLDYGVDLPAGQNQATITGSIFAADGITPIPGARVFFDNDPSNFVYTNESGDFTTRLQRDLDAMLDR